MCQCGCHRFHPRLICNVIKRDEDSAAASTAIEFRRQHHLNTAYRYAATLSQIIQLVGHLRAVKAAQWQTTLAITAQFGQLGHGDGRANQVAFFENRREHENQVFNALVRALVRWRVHGLFPLFARCAFNTGGGGGSHDGSS